MEHHLLRGRWRREKWHAGEGLGREKCLKGHGQMCWEQRPALHRLVDVDYQQRRALYVSPPYLKEEQRRRYF
jgi:hypothetical protein